MNIHATSNLNSRKNLLIYRLKKKKYGLLICTYFKKGDEYNKNCSKSIMCKKGK